MAEHQSSLLDAPPPHPMRPRVLLVGSAFASVASAMLFVGLLAIYLARRADVVNTGDSWLPQGAVLPLTQANMMFATLILSAVTLLWAADALRRDDRPNAYVALGLTLLFGFAYVNQASYMFRNTGLTVGNETGLLVLTIGWAHVVWILLGMAFVVLVGFRALFGQERKLPEGVNAAAIFWISSIAVYGIIWYAIYITK